jgi:hypothetical protein
VTGGRTGRGESRSAGSAKLCFDRQLCASKPAGENPAAVFSDKLMDSAKELANKAKTVEEAINLLNNAQARGRADVALAARRRLIELRAEKHGALPGSLEAEAFATIYAYEQTALGGRHASRTWQMVKKHGIVDTLERLVASSKPSAGYTKLIEAGLDDLAFEALVLRYPDKFSTKACAAARARLKR